MTTAIVVTHCAPCPFVRYRHSTEDMACTLAREPMDGFPDSPPDWCPLRTADRLVTLRVS